MKSIALLILLLAAGCFDSDNTPSCIRGTTRACFCNTGGAGEQTCLSNNEGYDSCVCLPDAGIDAPVDEPDAEAAASTFERPCGL